MFGNYCKKQLCLKKFLWQLQIALLSKDFLSYMVVDKEKLGSLAQF